MRTMLLLAALAVSLAASLAASAAQETFTAFPESGAAFNVLLDGDDYLTLRYMGWGPQWAHMGMSGTAGEHAGGTRALCKGTLAHSRAAVSLESLVSLTNARVLRIQLNLSASKDTDLMFVCAALGFGNAFKSGRVLVSHASGTNTVVALPLGRAALGMNVTAFTAFDAEGRATTVTLSPALDVPADGDARILLAKGALKADAPVHATMTIELPASVTFHPGAGRVPAEQGYNSWYAFTPSRDAAAPSEIGMQDWLDRPAGRHGRIVRDGDRLLYNGAPIKLWGLNLCYAACLPEKKIADDRAALYPKFGINTVRLHKFTESNYARTDSAASFDAEAVDRMDYQIAKFKEAGIFVNLSVHFGNAMLGPADRKHVPYIDEIGTFGQGRRVGQRIKAAPSTLFYSPELQTVHIQQMLNLLAHTNPYTGLTYAKDPAIAFIECVNEQSILFHSSMSPLKQYPAIRAMTAKRFSAWLKKKYGSQEALVKAWGPRAMNSFTAEVKEATGEDIDKGTVLPLGSPWFWDPVNLDTSQAFRRRRLLDSLEFLFELQCACYDRYVKALRSAGYEGEVLGSNWQAGRQYSHYYNLYSDYLVGTIDRHNYFGGGGRTRIANATMLCVPGAGMLGSGMQQVADRPFMLSEWIHVSPSEWRAEGPAIIGAYGMGLQGWDASYMFQNRDDGGVAREINKDQWEVTAPSVIGVFPAVARQVLRGDVKESDVVAPRNVSLASLREGTLDFSDTVEQEYDVKTFDSDKVPGRALAVARCVVNFTSEPRPTPVFDIAPYVSNGVFASATRQLHWKAGTERLDGSFTIDTPATKAAVGFDAGERRDLGEVAITPGSRFSAVYVTARERDRTIATSSNILVIAMARARNSGMNVFADRFILAPGTAPVVLEPVNARIRISKQGTPVVHVLDHDGRRTGRTIPVNDGTFDIDGARDKTPYYLVEYK
ncbi:glycoside hydrolase family 5 protein [bacterium]|nr:glycoside hydrolase family 5 protein [bacterium]